MQEALDSFYYIIDKYFEFIFAAYIFEGVSLGMIFICVLIFGVLFTYLLAVPKMRVANYSKGSDRNEND